MRLCGKRARVYVYTRVRHVCMLDCLKAELARIFIAHLRRFFENEAINLFEIDRNKFEFVTRINGCS